MQNIIKDQVKEQQKKDAIENILSFSYSINLAGFQREEDIVRLNEFERKNEKLILDFLVYLDETHKYINDYMGPYHFVHSSYEKEVQNDPKNVKLTSEEICTKLRAEEDILNEYCKLRSNFRYTEYRKESPNLTLLKKKNEELHQKFVGELKTYGVPEQEEKNVLELASDINSARESLELCTRNLRFFKVCQKPEVKEFFEWKKVVHEHYIDIQAAFNSSYNEIQFKKHVGKLFTPDLDEFMTFRWERVNTCIDNSNGQADKEIDDAKKKLSEAEEKLLAKLHMK